MDRSALSVALAPLLEAVGGVVVSGEDADVVVQLGDDVVGVRLPHLDGALDRLIAGVERELGRPLARLAREQKQIAVAMLHERGAFNLRKSVEDVAAALDVSRFTVYNYLDRAEGMR